MIEIKTESVTEDVEGGVEAHTVAEVRRLGMGDHVALISFDHRALLHCRSLAPEMATGHLFGRGSVEEMLAAAQDAGCTVLMPHKSQLADGLAVRVHDAGLKLATWVVDEPAELKNLARFGLYGVGSNRPGVLLQALENGLLD